MARREGSGDLSHTLAAGSELTYDHVCAPCSHSNKTCEAVGFCVDCSEFLCDSCYKVHLMPAPCRNHKLLDIEEAMKNPSVAGSLDVCTEKCTHHRNMIIEFYCPVHDHIGCGTCIALDHRNCEGVQYIPKIAMDTDGGEEFDRVIAQLGEILRKASDLSNEYKGNKARSQAIFDKAIQHVRKARKDVNEAFDRLERNIESVGQKMKQRDMQKMDGYVRSCDSIKVKVDDLTVGLRKMKQKGYRCVLFVALKANRETIKSLEHLLDTTEKNNTITEYVFQPSVQLDHFIRHRGSLGQLRLISKPKTTATEVGEFSVKVKSDADTCCISGLAMITSRRLVATDFNNKKAKLIDTQSLKVLSEYQLQAWPQDISSTEEAGEVAVTVPQLQQVILLRFRGDSLYLHKTIKTPGLCYGVTSVKDKLVVSLTEPERLEVMTRQGHVLHTVDKDRNGQQLFSDVRSLCANQETGTIYVPDYTKHTVTSVSMSGQVQVIYSDRDLQVARGVTVDPIGAVYVCGESSKNIHQITPGCKNMRILLSQEEGISDIKSLWYDKCTERLFVGQLMDYIKVYQMSF